MAVFAMLLVAWLVRRAWTVPGGEAVSATTPPNAATVAASDDPTARRRSQTVVPYVEPPRPPKMVAPVGAQAAADYRRRARYPRSSQPLASEDVDPIVRDREISPVESKGRGGAEPTLRVFPAAMGFEAPEPAILFAELVDQGHRVAAREIQATLMGEDMQPRGDVSFRDDGTEGDGVAGDRRYTAVIAAEGLGTALSTSHLVQVRVLLQGDDERRAATSFLYSTPHARPTGRYRDAVTDGSLVVGVEVDVVQAGRFHVEATLYSADGTEKIAWAQTAQRLEPGTQWLDLTYYGLMLRERGIDGPYLVRYVALSTTTEMPNAKNRIVEDAHHTGAYAASGFTDRPFDDPQLLEAAERLDRDPMPAGIDAGG